MVGEAGAVVVFEDGVGGDESFDDDVVDVSPHLVHVVAVIQQPLVGRRDPSDKINTRFLESIIERLRKS